MCEVCAQLDVMTRRTEARDFSDFRSSFIQTSEAEALVIDL